MRIVRRERPAGPVKVSFILLDWSCRESFHMLDYLAEQSVPREEYEVLWIEYYDRQPSELQQRVEAAAADGRPAPLDTHVVLEMPRSAYYHKHLMYNVGLVLAAGEIVCICDSDTMVGPRFVESILREFEADPNIVLHHDEVRNHSREFYPFRYPPLEDVRGTGCSTMVNRRPVGIWDTADPLHTRNYGACLSARRADLLAIGGADMHIDYLGHVCGPYELTFRLVNAGKREIWHPAEFLYHTWHPGEAGDNNYFGPHDGRSMSTTALAARETGRVHPLEESPAVARLRENPDAPEDELLQLAVNPAWLSDWDCDRMQTAVRSRPVSWGQIRMHECATSEAAADARAQDRPLRPFRRRFGPLARLRALPVLCRMFWSQWQCQRQAPAPLPSNNAAESQGTSSTWRWLLNLGQEALGLAAFLKRMWAYNRHLLRQCWIHLAYLADTGVRDVVLYGDGDAARLLVALSGLGSVRIRGICPFHPQPPACVPGVEPWDARKLRQSTDPIVVATFVNVDRHARQLAEWGVPRERLVLLQ